MLSKDAVKLLKWFEQHDDWITPDKIEEDYKNLDARDLKALKDQKMVDTQLNMDDGSWVKYRINGVGKAYLQGIRDQRLSELREWVNTVIAVASFLSGVTFSEPVKAFFRWILEWLT